MPGKPAHRAAGVDSDERTSADGEVSADETGKANHVGGVAAVDKLRERQNALGKAAAEYEGVGALGRHAPEGQATEMRHGGASGPLRTPLTAPPVRGLPQARWHRGPRARRGHAIIAAANSDGLAFYDLARGFDMQPWRGSTHGRVAPTAPVPAIRTRLPEPTPDERAMWALGAAKWYREQQ
jgi:hypothetical protein